MIDKFKMHNAVIDLLGAQAEDQQGWDIDNVELRFEMMGVSFPDFQEFLHERLEGMRHTGLDVDLAWSRGYLHGAVEFFLYGILTGKEDALDEEINEN